MTCITALKIAALLPLGLFGLVLLMFGIGEAASGDLSGLMHLVQLVVLVFALWLAWKRPLWGGALLTGMALLRFIALIPGFFLRPPGSVWNASLFLLILIPMLSGGLLLTAGWLEKKRV